VVFLLYGLNLGLFLQIFQYALWCVNIIYYSYNVICYSFQGRD